MSYLHGHAVHIGMHAAVGARTALDIRALMYDLVQSVLKNLLNGNGVILYLPAVKIGTAI